MENQIDVRDYDELSKSIGLAQYTVYKKYLSDLNLFPVVQPSQVFLDENAENCIRLVKLEELTHKKGEDVFQKLTTVYHASMSLGCNLIVMVDVDRIDAPANIYIGVRNNGFDKQEKTNLGISFRTLKSGLKSNFPGTKIKDVPSKEILPKMIEEIFGESAKYISSVSCIASRRDKAKTEDKTFVQGIERFIDAMQGNTYTAVFIAKPVSATEQSLIRDGYETIYSSLSAFRKSIWTYNSNESNSIMKSLSKGISKAITTGTTHTQSHSTCVGANLGINSTNSLNTSDAHMESTGGSNPTTIAKAGQAMSGAAGVVGLVGKIVAPIYPPVGGALLAANGLLSLAGGAMSGETENHSVADTITNSIGKSLGVAGGLNVGFSKAKADTTINTETETENETETDASTDTIGTGKSLQIENTNKPIDDMLVRIDDLLKRTQECEDYGAYNCSVYFISGKQESCMLGANTFRALMIGEGSSLEAGAINFWNGEKEPEKINTIKQYIKRFEHPLFAMPISDSIDTEEDFVKYTAGTIVSGLELPLHMGLPSRSVYGLPVIECAEFGREVLKYEIDDSKGSLIKIGHAYHMHHDEVKSIELDVNSLTSHTFITGSTGTGKSNAVYQLIAKIREMGKHFMVIEPAKGEYKDWFGKETNVLGTNSNETELLYINPFSFPDNIHVLEHVDRLIEILNACWPMYAAMPAVLKDAVERIYVSKGWNLQKSKCGIKGKNRFPTFADLLIALPEVMEESSYSSDTKSDYLGALVTRVKSLTNGLNGQLLCSGIETDEKTLFEEDTIIDLSRIGAMETRSFFMGILVMKLQEYHMSRKEKTDEELKHITILEEAHNLLRKTSFEQSQEGSNLQGKSVEMITNSIAEMRTYGEGFVIVDQAPGLLDEAVIRNTNTKIILRLPDADDRETVGKSVALNEAQINEVAKLPKGVAVVYQNNWVESVLCHFDKYEDKNAYCKKTSMQILPQDIFYLNMFSNTRFTSLKKEEVDVVMAWIENSKYARETKRIMKKAVEGAALSEREEQLVAYNVFEGKGVAKLLSEAITEEEGLEKADYFIQINTEIKDKNIVETIRNLIIQVIVSQNNKSELAKRYIEYSGKVR